MRTKGKTYYYSYKDITVASLRCMENAKLIEEVGSQDIQKVLKVFSSALIRIKGLRVKSKLNLVHNT